VWKYLPVLPRAVAGYWLLIRDFEHLPQQYRVGTLFKKYGKIHASIIA
jgi:hypothetical protein